MGYTESMNSMTKVGKRGVISLPEGIREESHLKEGDLVLVNTNPDGSITLRPATSLPVREYTEEDLRMFAEEDDLPPELTARVRAFLDR